MEKQKSHAFGKDVYLLGKGKDGNNYWLEEGSWDCDWYWGFGYVETYGKDSSHQHFNGLFLKKNVADSLDSFQNFFEETPLSDKEIWTLLETMKSFYIAKEYAEMVHRGGSHISNNPVKDLIKNEEEYNRINKVVIPALMEEVYCLLGKERELVKEENEQEEREIDL